MAISEHCFQQVGRLLQNGAVAGGQLADVPGERRHPSRSTGLEHLASSGCRVNALHTPVARVEAPGDQAVRLQTGHQAGDGGWSDLLGAREVAEGDRAGKDDDGECGEGRGAESGRLVLDAKAAQEVDGGRVQAVGDRLGAGGAPPGAAGSCASVR